MKAQVKFALLVATRRWNTSDERGGADSGRPTFGSGRRIA